MAAFEQTESLVDGLADAPDQVNPGAAAKAAAGLAEANKAGAGLADANKAAAGEAEDNEAVAGLAEANKAAAGVAEDDNRLAQREAAGSTDTAPKAPTAVKPPDVAPPAQESAPRPTQSQNPQKDPKTSPAPASALAMCPCSRCGSGKNGWTPRAESLLKEPAKKMWKKYYALKSDVLGAPGKALDLLLGASGKAWNLLKTALSGSENNKLRECASLLEEVREVDESESDKVGQIKNKLAILTEKMEEINQDKLSPTDKDTFRSLLEAVIPIEEANNKGLLAEAEQADQKVHDKFANGSSPSSSGGGEFSAAKITLAGRVMGDKQLNSPLPFAVAANQNRASQSRGRDRDSAPRTPPGLT